jgi:hypothetical protein
VLRHGRLAVAVAVEVQGAALHLLEAERQDAVREAAADRAGGEVERGRAGGAVVVHVRDRESGHAELVHGALASGRLAVDVPDVRLLDLVEVDAGIGQGGGARLAGHVGVVPPLATTGLLEPRHPDTDDEDAGTCCGHLWLLTKNHLDIIRREAIDVVYAEPACGTPENGVRCLQVYRTRIRVPRSPDASQRPGV